MENQYIITDKENNHCSYAATYLEAMHIASRKNSRKDNCTVGIKTLSGKYRFDNNAQRQN